MPRTGGIYYLPSPPSPLLPNTLAAAEDIMTLLQDIATALTQSVPTDGSAAFTGPINFNNQTISGASNISATGTVSGNTGTFANLTVTGAVNLNYLVNNLNANGYSITNGGTFSASAINSGSSMWIVGGTLGSGMNANGQNISNAGALSANTLTANYTNMNGDIQMNGHTLAGVGAMTGSMNFDGQTNFNGLMNANGNYLVNVSEITGWQGALITNSTFYAYNSIAMQGSNIYNVGYITYAGRAAPADALQAVRSMAAQRTGERNLVEAVDTLIAAVAELSHAPA